MYPPFSLRRCPESAINLDRDPLYIVLSRNTHPTGQIGHPRPLRRSIPGLKLTAYSKREYDVHRNPRQTPRRDRQVSHSGRVEVSLGGCRPRKVLEERGHPIEVYRTRGDCSPSSAAGRHTLSARTGAWSTRRVLCTLGDKGRVDGSQPTPGILDNESLGSLPHRGHRHQTREQRTK